jgi:membrane-bound serine protease (ClpP class)
MTNMRIWRYFLRAIFTLGLGAVAYGAEPAQKIVYVLPIRDEIEESMSYQVRRGVKEALDMKASALVLHMNTPGGKGDAMREIMVSVAKFTPADQIYTLVDTEAFSAGAFISAATRHIYMVPGSNIGAATPVILGGQSGAPQELPPKFVSAYAGMIRAAAEQNGHNPLVFDAMVNKQKGLVIEGKEILAKGDILTLTTQEATALYGKPAKPLLAEGTVKNLDELVKKIAGENASVVIFQPTGYEKTARFLTMIAPLLMTAGLLFGYLEFKTPGFGIFGILAVLCFAVYFLGQYVAGLSGYGPLILFFIGVVLIAVEFFLLPGLMLPGLLGVAVAIGALLYAMIDRYPGDSYVPSVAQLRLPVVNVGTGLLLAILGIAILATVLPKRVRFRALQEATVSGPGTDANTRFEVGTRGVALTALRPAGTARFGERIADVVSEGVFIEKNAPIEVLRVEGMRVVVGPA